MCQIIRYFFGLIAVNQSLFDVLALHQGEAMKSAGKVACRQLRYIKESALLRKFPTSKNVLKDPLDDVIRATVSNDGDSEEGDDGSGGESENSDNDLAPESIFIKTKSGHVTTNYNRVCFK